MASMNSSITAWSTLRLLRISAARRMLVWRCGDACAIPSLRVTVATMPLWLFTAAPLAGGPSYRQGHLHTQSRTVHTRLRVVRGPVQGQQVLPQGPSGYLGHLLQRI